MALIACHECGMQVSTEAGACPGCGAKPGPDKHTRAGVTVLQVLGAIAVVALVVRCNSSSTSAPSTPPQAAAKATAEAVADQARKDRDAKRFDIAYDVAKAIRKSMRDPDSTVFETVGVNADATVVCVQYRSRNGFGGMNREAAVYLGGDVKKATKALISKHCNGLMDYSSAATK